MDLTMNTDIVIHCSGGLGNRLTTLYSTYALTLKYGFKFKYFWDSDFGYEWKFNSLFDYDLPLIGKNLNSGIVRNELFNESGRTHKKSEILTVQDLHSKILWLSPGHPRIENDLTYTTSSYKHIFEHISISSKLLNKINNIHIPKNTIGIHIRGGDIKNPQNLDPNDKRRYIFPTNIFTIIDNSSNYFFISCEDSEDQMLFKNRYSNNKIIYLENCNYDRISELGLQDAFINLILLSKCSMIIGNMGSTFSGVARMIGEIDFKDCTNEG